ncbi:Gluconate transport-inducing protein [Basidiobolus ranarum]|uniref:Gluconate transport-inducing protein n=1 Tax=Basidiobolus ranarum TaxID=34480 RepID=A0ABR2WGG3_9FUNG
MSNMETYYGVIESIQDALLIFEACRLGYLRRVQRRLSDKERQSLRSGSVYVWEEEEAGMRRWTDGRTWSPSRVHGSFLTYSELEGKRKSVKLTDSPPASSMSGTVSDFEAEYGCLIKQSLSCTTADQRKLHLVAYYRKSQLSTDNPPSPSKDSSFAQIVIPKGLYPDMTEEWPVSLTNPTGTNFEKELQRNLALKRRGSSPNSSIVVTTPTTNVNGYTSSNLSSKYSSISSEIKPEEASMEQGASSPVSESSISSNVGNDLSLHIPNLPRVSLALPTSLDKMNTSQECRTLPPIEVPYLNVRLGSGLHSEDQRQLAILSTSFTLF